MFVYGSVALLPGACASAAASVVHTYHGRELASGDSKRAAVGSRCGDRLPFSAPSSAPSTPGAGPEATKVGLGSRDQKNGRRRNDDRLPARCTCACDRVIAASESCCGCARRAASLELRQAVGGRYAEHKSSAAVERHRKAGSLPPSSGFRFQAAHLGSSCFSAAESRQALGAQPLGYRLELSLRLGGPGTATPTPLAPHTPDQAHSLSIISPPSSPPHVLPHRDAPHPALLSSRGSSLPPVNRRPLDPSPQSLIGNGTLRPLAALLALCRPVHRTNLLHLAPRSCIVRAAHCCLTTRGVAASRAAAGTLPGAQTGSPPRPPLPRGHLRIQGPKAISRRLTTFFLVSG